MRQILMRDTIFVLLKEELLSWSLFKCIRNFYPHNLGLSLTPAAWAHSVPSLTLLDASQKGKSQCSEDVMHLVLQQWARHVADMTD